ncbi:MAG: hypothetical protein U0573_11510 [Phycisphaerales bacterium]|nr:coagulation factor 5/8 type domain-containing protein [Planctomycetota bacterium]
MGMSTFARLAASFLLLLGAHARGDDLFRDDFADVSKWTLQASDGVVAEIVAQADGGKSALRLRFDFRAGSGFVVVRRRVGVPLPENYVLNVQIRGGGPANNFETKLLDSSGDNVWWVNQRDYVPPERWTWERFKRRHFSFAWGPAAGKPHETLGAIEFAIAASSGGAGFVEFSDLSLQSLPKPEVRSESISVVQANGTIQREGLERLFERGGAPVTWKPGREEGVVTFDLGRTREFGGVLGNFEPGTQAYEVRVESSLDGASYESVGSALVGNSGRFLLPLRDLEASFVRIRTVGGSAVTTLKSLEFAPLDFGATMNGTFARIASETPRGLLPRYLIGEQQYWTVVGVADDKNEGLLGADGAVEVDKEQFSIEPIIVPESGDPLTWANAKLTQELADGYLPLPSVTRDYTGLRLRIDAFAFGDSGESSLAVRYTVTNTGEQRAKGRLLLAVRPLQVNPPWQDLKTSGGFAPIDAIGVDATRDPILIIRRARPDTVKTVQIIGGIERIASSISDYGDAAIRVIRGDEPIKGESPQENRRALSAAAVCRYDLAPGESREWAAVSPFHGAFERAGPLGSLGNTPIDLSLSSLRDREEAMKKWWREELNRVTLRLPAARDLENTFRTAQAHILINRDGPAIQPGSRTYERSWIRDGCLTSSALLATGHADRVREFIDWYAPYQYPSGKVPCVVDRRGPDPVPENDSHGQLLYLLHKYYLFTHDKETLAKNYQHVVMAVDYIDSLRKQRMTGEYANADGLKRAEYGLVPESISHEGYSAKPMHSYWDDFFVEKGLQDAADIARVLGRTEDEAEFQKMADEFRSAVIGSIRRATAHHKIDYIPGCVELGDFDATSTTVALWPCGAGAWLDHVQLERTFDRFYGFAMGRIDGSVKYNEYTPYEWRIVGSMIRLGWPQKAWKLMDFYMADRRPAAWNQWGEIVWRKPETPKFIGDMPHTWVASDFLNSVRSLFVYEDERTKSLMIGAGIRPEWLAGEGVAIRNWPTEFGTLSFTAKREGGRVRLEYEFAGAGPPGGMTVSPTIADSPAVLRELKGVVELGK